MCGILLARISYSSDFCTLYDSKQLQTMSPAGSAPAKWWAEALQEQRWDTLCNFFPNFTFSNADWYTDYQKSYLGCPELLV